MRKNPLSLLIFITMPFLLLSTTKKCAEETVVPEASLGTSGTAQPAAKSAHDPVALVWQKRFFEQIEQSDATVGHALFTSGGWADQGQFLIFVEDDKATFKKVKPGSKKINSTKQLSPRTWTKTLKVLSDSQNLGDVDAKVMDGVLFEYVHAINENGKVRAVKRVYINNPDLSTKPKHQALIDSFKRISVK